MYKIQNQKKKIQYKGRYETGQKRCSTCETYIEWDGHGCPCCNCTLRVKPRNTKNRQRLQKIKQIRRI